MNLDFTLNKYSELLEAFQSYGFESLVLRHDVDLRPENSLLTARMEAEKGLFGVYYFRAVPESWDERIIREIAGLGHEVGYHYESLSTCNGDVDAAFADFCTNLEALRILVPVKSICMHGSPRSPYDSKDIWKKYDYHDLGIDTEPYLDTDFSRTFYLTDTGRRWDGFKVSIRDKIPQYQDDWIADGLVFHSTDDVIDGLQSKRIPKSMMVTIHPQRWNRFGYAWCREIVLQNMKNIVKKTMINKKSR